MWMHAAPLMITDTTYTSTTYTTTLLEDIEELTGDSVQTLTYISGNQETSILETLDVDFTPYLVFPYMYSGGFNTNPSLSRARDGIRSYVNSGGKVLMFGSTAWTTMNELFGWSVTEGWSVREASLNTAASNGTSFEGGPASLLMVDRNVDTVRPNGLPPSARIMYTTGDACVFTADYGAGSVVFLGNNWYWSSYYTSNRARIQESWKSVLNRAITYSPTEATPSAPTVMAFVPPTPGKVSHH